MGRDKALLPWNGLPLADFVARAVVQAAGTVTLIGDPHRYSHLGYTVIPDLYPGEGPLGGILTALNHTSAEWNLLVACDMPSVSAEFLANLLDIAERSPAGVLLPVDLADRAEPLCAVYHKGCAATLAGHFHSGIRKITAAFADIAVTRLPIAEMAHLKNVNTPAEWSEYAAR